jgi:hypothetical protein
MISVQLPPAQLQLDGVRKAHDPDQDYALSLWAALGVLAHPMAILWNLRRSVALLGPLGALVVCWLCSGRPLFFLNDNVSYNINNERDTILVVFAELV